LLLLRQAGHMTGSPYATAIQSIQHRATDPLTAPRNGNVGYADVLCIWLTFGELEAFEERDMQREAAQTGKAWTSIGVAS
jgi:hypothetical protein